MGEGSPLTLSLGAVSYGLAAIGYLILTILLLTSWEGRSQGMRLIVASAVTVAWAVLLAVGVDRSPAGGLLAILSELFRYGAWLFVLTGLMRSAGIGPLIGRFAHIAWLGAALLLILMPLLANAGFPTPSPSGFLATAGLLLALLGLLLLEQIHRNSRRAGRHALKFLVIGLGLAFAYDLFLFSQAQLLRGIEPTAWQARGLVTALSVPMLAIAARRNPQWSLNLFVSRHVVFYTASALFVGAYLLLMAAGGYWVRLHGGTWGRVAQIAFVAGAAAVLAAVMASSTLRRRLRVFLNQHFYRNKYDYRLEWLRFVETLSIPLEGVDPRANALRAMTQVINSPGGVLYVRTEDGEAFNHVATWPADDFERLRRASLPASDELIEFLSERQWVIDLAELRTTPDLYGNLSLPGIIGDAHGDPSGRDRLIVPLTHVDTLIGFAVLAAPPEPFEPNYEDRDLLKMMGRHVAVHVAQYDADRRLAESRQFEAYHRLTAFVMHDLRNLAAQLALIVTNAERHKRNPEFVDDAIGTIANSTERMQRLIGQLQRREDQSGTRRIKLAEVARRACERCSSRQPAPRCGSLVEDAWVEADPERLTTIVEHVIRNAQDATSADGSVVVSVSADGSGIAAEPPVPAGETSQLRVPAAALTVSDSGVGMSAEFVSERLFTPFDTTKGSKGMGIGAYQVREYVKSLGGRVDVASRIGQGTRMTLRIPLAMAPGET